MWFQRKTPLPMQGEPTILASESNSDFDFMAGDAAGAYVPAAGLKRYIRRLIYVKPATLLVLNDIETNRPRNLELRFHPVENANVKIQDLTPEGVSIEKGTIEGKDRDGEPFPQYTVRMRTNASRWRHAAAISWANGGAKPDEVTIERQGDAIAFRVGSRKVVFSWKTGKPSLQHRIFPESWVRPHLPAKANG